MLYLWLKLFLFYNYDSVHFLSFNLLRICFQSGNQKLRLLTESFESLLIALDRAVASHPFGLVVFLDLADGVANLHVVENGA